MPLDGGVLLGLRPMSDEPELPMLDGLEPPMLLPDRMPLEPALDPGLAWRSRQFWSAVPVRPEQYSVLEAPAEGEPVGYGLVGMDGLTWVLGEEPMFGLTPEELPVVP